MKTRLGFLLVLALAGTLDAMPLAPLRFDSDTSVILDGHLKDLVLRTEATDAKDVREEIEEQLFFMIGTLNQYESCPDIANAKVTITKEKPIEGTKYREITYSSEMDIAWSKKYKVPEKLLVGLPLQTDEKSLKKYYKNYCEECSENPRDPDLEVDSFFYYYRPNKKGCPILNATDAEAMVCLNSMTFTPSLKQTQDKYPEYDKVWADGRLVVTAIFGTNEADAKNNKDVGVQAYNWMYAYLRYYFGNPVKSNVELKEDDQPGLEHPDVEMEWKTAKGLVNVNILLINKDSLAEADQVFATRYNERTKISDMVSYSGHSGYGVNVKALADMGTFTPKQWQLFFMNGCDSFAYVDDVLRAAHQTVNPGSKPYEYFNIITNAMPAGFFSMAAANMTVIEALVTQQKTYKLLLAGIDPFQKACVIGEQDNQFKPK